MSEESKDVSKHQAMEECLFGRETRRNEGGVNILEAACGTRGSMHRSKVDARHVEVDIVAEDNGNLRWVLVVSEKLGRPRRHQIRLTMMRARKIAKLR